MILYPRAKINLGLYVTERRNDGFHSIETLFYPLGLADLLEFVIDAAAEEDVLEVSGIEIPGRASENLLLKACRLFREQVFFPFIRIHLHKRIPIGAGLGGGSSDASFLLRGINAELGYPLGDLQLASMALMLGSDCPFFLLDGPAIGRGRGELLEHYPISLAGYYFYLFSPGIHVSTREAYQGVSLHSGGINLIENLGKGPDHWTGFLENSFETSVFSVYPEIAKLKQSIYQAGALYAAMSGSGSAVFGFSREPLQFSPELASMLIWSECLQ